jgi:hypothetical protein
MKEQLSAKDKRKMITELNDEVNELHPLLRNIFPKLPRINHVDYTHGSFEKGADFVLSRMDDTLDDLEFIGIVVKTGKITNTFSKLFDQIEECSKFRYVFEGKKQVRIDEVWVLTNDTISINAKETINEKYYSKKIKFISVSKIVEWVDKYFNKFWGELPIEIGLYLQKIESEMTTMNNELSLLPPNIESIYIEPVLRKIDQQKTYKNRGNAKPKEYGIDEIIENNDFIIIEAEGGAGKSQLARNTILKYTDPSIFKKTETIPIYTTFQSFQNECLCSFQKLLNMKITNKLDVNRKTLIFIDGFDESLDNNRNIKQEIDDLINEAKSIKDLKVVLTTRPLTIVKKEEISPYQSYGYEIKSIGIKGTITILKHVCRQIEAPGRLFEDLKKSDLFKQLPQNPISAVLLAHLINENSRELPSNITDIYSRYMELTLGKWDIDKGLLSLKEYEISSRIVPRLAKYFIENDLSHISITEGREIFDDYISSRPVGDIDTNKLFDKIAQRSGVLIKNSENNTINFKHRSFAEYFYASYQIQYPDTDFINSRAFTLHWKTIYMFYLGLQKDAEQQLSLLFNTSASDNPETVYKVSNMASYFMAAYSTHNKILEGCLPSLIIEYTRAYLNVIQGDKTKGLEFIPEGIILEVFKAIFISSYSYEFFKKALELAVLEISHNTSINEIEEMYALFFISVIYRSLKLENPFDSYIDSFKGKIPGEIEFSLYYETKSLKITSPKLKRIEKKVNSSLKASKPFREFYHSFFYTSLKDRKLIK